MTDAHDAVFLTEGTKLRSLEVTGHNEETWYYAVMGSEAQAEQNGHICKDITLVGVEASESLWARVYKHNGHILYVNMEHVTVVEPLEAGYGTPN